MQIKSTSLFKNKWNHFIQKLSPPQPQQQETQQQCIPERKYSDTMSFDSNTSMTDKFRQALPTFLRRNSSGTISTHHDIQEHTTIDYFKELERFQALYVLTLDEVIYIYIYIIQ
jgi:hypothetical protein